MSTIRKPIADARPSSERRRKPEAVRKDALEVARELLIANGPRAITLKAVGDRLGMSHANLIHHFGSAEAFQAQLRDAMVEDITRKATGLIGDDPTGMPHPGAIVDQVFEAYAGGGIGMLMAWSVLTGGEHQADSIRKTTGELVTVVEGTLSGPDAGAKAREIVALVTLLAFADSLIGRALASTIDADPDATRRLTTRIVEMLATAG
jgi:AcrR family transcriptional regulator